jgi:hypothetical protein
LLLCPHLPGAQFASHHLRGLKHHLHHCSHKQQPPTHLLDWLSPIARVADCPLLTPGHSHGCQKHHGSLELPASLPPGASLPPFLPTQIHSSHAPHKPSELGCTMSSGPPRPPCGLGLACTCLVPAFAPAGLSSPGLFPSSEIGVGLPGS